MKNNNQVNNQKDFLVVKKIYRYIASTDINIHFYFMKSYQILFSLEHDLIVNIVINLTLNSMDDTEPEISCTNVIKLLRKLIIEES